MPLSIIRDQWLGEQAQPTSSFAHFLNDISPGMALSNEEIDEWINDYYNEDFGTEDSDISDNRKFR